MSTIRTLLFDVDGFRLVGCLHLPDDVPQPPVVIGCHGLFANRESPKQTRLAELCSANGIAYFRFDHRGCGESQGRFAKVTSLPARCRDLYHAIRLMETHPGNGPLLALFGSSFGGSVVLGVSTQKRIPAVVTFAAPIHSLSQPLDALPELSDYAGEPGFSERMKFDLRPALAAVSNILIVHGDRDVVVPVAHSRELLSRCSPPKKLLIQADGDHPMSSPEHQGQFGDAFLEWITRAAARMIEVDKPPNRNS